MAVNVRANPLKPTARQVEEHNARGHVPYRSWCEHCVLGSGKELPHCRGSHDDSILLTFACDYAFLTSESDPEDKITIFIVKEFTTNSLFATVCPRKGTECQVGAELFLDALTVFHRSRASPRQRKPESHTTM